MYYIACLIYLALITEFTSTQCITNLDSLQDRSPILLNNSEILNSESQFLSIKPDETIQLLCSGTDNGILGSDTQHCTARCIDTKFLLDFTEEPQELQEILCRRMPASQSRQVGECNDDGTLIELGFEIDADRFIALVSVCFNTETAQTYWTKNYLKSTGYYWKQKTYKHFEMDFIATDLQPYSVYRQHKLDKGHLSPKGDFYTANEKRMTYYFVNVAPQVKRFNNENWRKLEESIREHSHGARKNYHIYTGTIGNAGYLYRNSMPRPKYFWKAVIEEDTGKGISFIGVNDVQQTYPDLCVDICPQVAWLQAGFQNARRNIQDGYVYCCSIDALESVPEIRAPPFTEYRHGIP